MFILKRIGCRIFQGAFRLALPVLPYREPKIISKIDEIPEVLKSEGKSAVIIVTDKGIVNNGLVKPLEGVLKNAGIRYAIYDNTQPNPTVKNVEEALECYNKEGLEAIITIGGGSAMDCAKALGARVAYPHRTLGNMAGVLKVMREIPTLIAIPTTAGTGSETTLAAVITDSDTKDKYAIMSFPLIPKYAVLDPILTYTLPPHLTASTGMDALTHATEAYIGRSTTKKTRALALEATKLIFENIEKAYLDGKDHDARQNMLLAAFKAGISFSESYVGYIHALAHSLGGKYGTPHGLANAVIMPYVLEAYGESAHKKLHELGIAAGVCTPEDSDADGARAYIEAIKNLNRRMNIPDKLDGIIDADIDSLAAHAEKEANPLYPVPKLMEKEDLKTLYHLISDRKN